MTLQNQNALRCDSQSLSFTPVFVTVMDRSGTTTTAALKVQLRLMGHEGTIDLLATVQKVLERSENAIKAGNDTDAECLAAWGIPSVVAETLEGLKAFLDTSRNCLRDVAIVSSTLVLDEGSLRTAPVLDRPTMTLRWGNSRNPIPMVQATSGNYREVVATMCDFMNNPTVMYRANLEHGTFAAHYQQYLNEKFPPTISAKQFITHLEFVLVDMRPTQSRNADAPLRTP